MTEVGHPPLSEVNIHLVDSVDKATSFMSWLGERRGVLAVDTETGGLEPWKQPLRLVQFGDAVTGWAIPWDLWGGVALEAIQRYEGEFVGHNLKFDVQFIERHGKIEWPWSRSHDTMIKAHILDSTKSVALKALADRLVDRRSSWGQERLHDAMKAQSWTWATVPTSFTYYWFYGGLDTVLTARVDDILSAQLGAHNPVYDLEMQVARITAGMETRGMRLDIDYSKATLEQLRLFSSQARVWAQQEYGINNIGSNKQLADALKKEGVEFTKITPTGQAALDEEVLSAIDHPLAETALKVRKADKIASTYFETFLQERDGETIHCNIRTLGARTGRMSITSPAMQTLPRGPIVRDAFIAEEDNVIVTADYDQIEMRLMAHFSQDAGLIAAFKDETDFFINLARMVWNDPTIDNKKDPRRAIVKGVAYGKAYGAGTATMAHTAGITFDEMQPVHDEFNARFPGVQAFQRQVENVAGRRQFESGEAYVVTPLGRKLVADTGKNYTLTNYLIQSHAGEILKQALVRLDNAGLGPHMLLPVHDEVVFSLPRDGYLDMIPVIKECMQNTTDYAVEITCGADGPYERWGEKYR